MKEAIPRLVAATGCTRAEAECVFGERAGIRQFLAGLPRAEAEAAAYHDALRVLTEMINRPSTKGR